MGAALGNRAPSIFEIGPLVSGSRRWGVGRGRQKQILAQCAVTAGNTMRSVAGVAWIAPARGRASQTITNIMHTVAARLLWKPKWPRVKTKPPQPAKPPQPSTTGRAGCNARFLLKAVHVSGAPSGGRTGKGLQMANPRPTPKVGNLGSALATRHRRQPCRLFPRQAIQRRPRETDRGDGTRPPIRPQRRGTWSADRDHSSSENLGAENGPIVPEKSTGP